MRKVETAFSSGRGAGSRWGGGTRARPGPVIGFAWAALFSILAACAGPAPEDASSSTSGAEAPKAEAEAPTTQSGTPAPEVPARAGTGGTETAAPPEARTADLPPPVDPQRIMGLSREELSDLLGKPQFRRRDITAEIWQYRHTECILDVFLYESGKGYRVFHFEMREGKNQAVSGTRCLAALLDARNRDGAG